MRSARGGSRLRRLGRLASRLVGRLAAGSAATVMLLAPPGAVAQGAGAPAISIPPSITANADTTAVLPITVGPADAIPARSFISVRGLPPAVSLQDAHAVGPGAWAVPLSVLPVSAIIPAGVSGQSQMVVSLMATDGQLLAQGRSMLVIQPGSAPAPIAAPAARAPATDDGEDPDQARARAERLHSRGEAFLANGNIMGARDFFERAADAGLAASALSLAATYDPDVLAKLQVQGVAPDLALARKWYARAGELGSTEAAERLKQIASE